MASLHRSHYMLKGIVLLALALVTGASRAGAGIVVAPVPWAPESQKTALGNLTDGITFAYLPLEGEILIYTLNGTPVKKIAFNDGTRQAKWYGKNDAGEDVASGVYFWVVKSGEGVKSGKLIVMR